MICKKRSRRSDTKKNLKANDVQSFLKDAGFGHKIDTNNPGHITGHAKDGSKIVLGNRNFDKYTIQQTINRYGKFVPE